MDTLEVQYSDMVRTLTKPGRDILMDMTPMKANLMHLGAGVATEGGEILDVIKAHCVYGKPLDVEGNNGLLKEIGDSFFFLESLLQSLGYTREDVLRLNMEKLAKRYEGMKYSDEAAKERKDMK